MSQLFELVTRPDLGEPVMVMVLDGWIDAGLGAQQARMRIEEQVTSELIATFDIDTLLDHRARRPTMQLVDGVHSAMMWPTIELRAATDTAGQDFLLLVGVEPDHLWAGFAQAVTDLALELGVRMVTGLGAYPAPVAHTRPVDLAATATSVELARQVGFVGGSIVVPAGIQAVIEDRCGDLGVPAVGLWAQVPHYASAMPYPAAAVALIEGLGRLGGPALDPGAELAEAAQLTHRRIDELVGQNPEHQAMVAQLEAQGGSDAVPGLGAIPSGDELAAEVERFLRDQGRD